MEAPSRISRCAVPVPEGVGGDELLLGVIFRSARHLYDDLANKSWADLNAVALRAISRGLPGGGILTR